jgi:YVTN family beta-propeller protein
MLKKIERTSLLICLIILSPHTGHGQQETVLRVVETIALPDVKGRIDHMALDPAGHRLFVAALGNNSVEVIDLSKRKSIKSIHGLKDPQGVLVVPEQNLLFVANGGDGVLRIYNAKSLDLVKAIRFSGDADNLRYDRQTGYVYVGYGEGAIGIVDSKSFRRIGDIVLPGHPESFQLETKRQRLFVNVPSAGKIIIIDRTNKGIIADWPVEGFCSNFPMALDEGGKRLFIGCRNPAKIILYDTDTGKQVSEFPIAGDADDLYFDAVRKRIYVSCGSGVLQIFEQGASDFYQSLAAIPAGAGARTSLFAPEQARLYVAVPRSGRKPAEIMVFLVRP